MDSSIWDGATASEFSKRPSGIYNVESQQRNTIWVNQLSNETVRNTSKTEEATLTSDVLVLKQAPS